MLVATDGLVTVLGSKRRRLCLQYFVSLVRHNANKLDMQLTDRPAAYSHYLSFCAPDAITESLSTVNAER